MQQWRLVLEFSVVVAAHVYPGSGRLSMSTGCVPREQGRRRESPLASRQAQDPRITSLPSPDLGRGRCRNGTIPEATASCCFALGTTSTSGVSAWPLE